MNTMELRTTPELEVKLETRGEGEEKRTVLAGRGIPYNEDSEDMGFIERIAPGAFRESIAQGDVRCLFNHNHDIVLGRQSNGTLRLFEDETGVRYEADINENDQAARDAAARIERGDITGNSFGFIVRNRDDAVWEEIDGVMYRTILRAELFEVGPQTFPAYPTTDVSARSREAILEEGRAFLEAQKNAKGSEVETLRRGLELDEQDAALEL